MDSSNRSLSFRAGMNVNHIEVSQDVTFAGSLVEDQNLLLQRCDERLRELQVELKLLEGALLAIQHGGEAGALLAQDAELVVLEGLVLLQSRYALLLQSSISTAHALGELLGQYQRLRGRLGQRLLSKELLYFG